MFFYTPTEHQRSARYTPYICPSHLILLLTVFKPGPALAQILPSTASSSVNFGPKASAAVGLTQPLHSQLYSHMPYSALARIWTGNLMVNPSIGRSSLMHPVSRGTEEAGDLKLQKANFKRLTQKAHVLRQYLGRWWVHAWSADVVEAHYVSVLFPPVVKNCKRRKHCKKRKPLCFLIKK